MTTLRDQICQATDALLQARRNRASYDELKALATTILELRQEAERARFGKVKTAITSVTIAHLLR